VKLILAYSIRVGMFAVFSCANNLYSSPPGYYVSMTGSDSNSGTACNPWRTLQHAANTAGAGATVHVVPGTYTRTC